jgi:hypothetical protein
MTVPRAHPVALNTLRAFVTLPMYDADNSPAGAARYR